MTPDRAPAERRAGDLPLHQSLVLESCVRLLFHTVLLTSLFFLFAGHNSPGGGFIGGLVASTAFVLRYLATSTEAPRPGTRVRPATVLGTGLLLAVGTGLAPFLAGGQLLESAYLYVPLPVLGELPLASVLVFDTGVYLIVVGIVLAVLSTLGMQEHASLGSRWPADDEPEEGP